MICNPLGAMSRVLGTARTLQETKICSLEMQDFEISYQVPSLDFNYGRKYCGLRMRKLSQRSVSGEVIFRNKFLRRVNSLNNTT